jgi:hypothetical protein
MARWAKVGSRMLCALSQFGSCVSAGEQPVAGDGADAAQRAAHRLVEAALVADFLDHVGAGHDDQRRAHHVRAGRSAPMLARQLHQALQRRIAESTVSMLPTIGFPGGFGIGFDSRPSAM